MAATHARTAPAQFVLVINAFARRWLSARTFELIVGPALADFEFDRQQRHIDWAAYVAVLIALVGAVRIDVMAQVGTFVLLTMVPACYYFVMIAVCFDFFAGPNPKGLIVVALPLLVLSVAPVLVCFWPEPATASTEV